MNHASDRLWAGVLLAGAVILLGVGIPGFRPRPDSGIPDETGIPELVEPRHLDLPAPPTVFRWEPGGDDVQLSQVLVFDGQLRRIWQSGPIRPGVSELEVSADIYAGIEAGAQCFWRVREIRNGKPRAASPIAEFTFLVDNRGYGPGEAPVEEYLK